MTMTETPQMAPVKGGVVAYLNVDGVVKAVEFYQKAFGAELAAMMPPDASGRTMHAHIYVNGSSIMLSDFYPEHGVPKVEPQAFSLTIMTDSIDADFKRAVEAGAAVVTEPQDMFWGDRFGALKDPWGVAWAMNQGRK
jgi:PhnB protein